VLQSVLFVCNCAKIDTYANGSCCQSEGVLHRVAVCCSVLQHVAVCCSVVTCVAVCCSVLQCVAVCCIVATCVAVCCGCSVLGTATHCNIQDSLFWYKSLISTGYGVATISRLLQIIGLFCRMWSLS